MKKNLMAADLPLELSPQCEAEIKASHSWLQENFATKNSDALRRDETRSQEDSIRRPAYLRDSEKILHIPPYNRLAGKTQVFSFRDNDDLTRRGLHVQLVSRVARDIGRALGLNLELIEAIALGHDIGHTPFGHAGERILNSIFHERTGRYFMHNVQSVRVLDVLYGRNLTLQTLDGIICHNGEFEQQKLKLSQMKDFEEFDQMVHTCWTQGPHTMQHMRPMTREGCVVRLADIIAYVGKDRQDAITAGILDEDAFEDGLGGAYNSWALAAFTTDIIENSLGTPFVQMSEQAFCELRRSKKENYEKIYMTEKVSGQLTDAIDELFEQVYYHELDMLARGDESSVIFKHHILPIAKQLEFYGKTYDFEDDLDLCVVDFISSMTDNYFITMVKTLYPEQVKEIIPHRSYFDHVDIDLI